MEELAGVISALVHDDEHGGQVHQTHGEVTAEQAESVPRRCDVNALDGAIEAVLHHRKVLGVELVLRTQRGHGFDVAETLLGHLVRLLLLHHHELVVDSLLLPVKVGANENEGGDEE